MEKVRWWKKKGVKEEKQERRLGGKRRGLEGEKWKKRVRGGKKG